MKFRIILILSVFILLACNKESKEEVKTTISKANETSGSIKSAFLKRIPSSESNLIFSNDITDNVATKENLFDYDYFFNGSGVGVGDINNDGLKDIFFAGNQVPNKLFLNKGNLTFEDISESANINVKKHWSSGVSFVDINNDGWLDIYVSQGGPRSIEERKNILLINQKDNTFKEEASTYGLDDHGISTQSAFFDYDKDGDLDCIVMNENDYYGTDPSTFYSILKDEEKLMENCSHLYRNDNGKFINITKQAGLLKPTFGLGLCVSDINNDDWLDIYIANDYYVPDAKYINNKNGTFTDAIKENTNQVSFYGMGVDIEDLNNDALQDIFVLDMASSDHVRSKTLMASMNVANFNLLTDDLDLQHQYMFNSLQLNVGNDKFHNISQLTKMSKTDWSWAGLMMDIDNNETKDVFVTNGYRKYALDNDIRMKILNAKRQYRGNVPLDIKKEIYGSLPSEKLPNKLFFNHGDLKFEDLGNDAGITDPSFSNGAAYADLDNDGDLDLVINNIDEEAFLYKNLTVENNYGNFIKVKCEGNLSESFPKITLKYNGKKQFREAKKVRGYLSSLDETAHFGLSEIKTIDTISVRWLSGKTEERYNVEVNQEITFREKDAGRKVNNELNNQDLAFKVEGGTIQFVHQENEYNDFEKEVLLPYKQSSFGPHITKGDVNGDGKTDLYIGGASGQPGELFVQTASGFMKQGNPVFFDDAAHEDMEALFFDADNDSDQDLYVVSGGNEFKEFSPILKDRLYLNDGNGNFSKSNQSLYNSSGRSVTKIDYDNDGDQDLIIGNRIIPQKYPVHSESIIYQNNNGKFKNVASLIAPELRDFGMVNKVITTDFNNDGWEDFIAVGEWTHIGMFQNDNGTFKDVSKDYGLDNEKGWWFSIIESDLNKDGHKDYVLGNVGNNIKFKVSKEKPLRVYGEDFDDNGTHDIVLSSIYKGMFVPVRGKECSTQQMPFISEKFPTYNEFANSTLEDIYGTKIHTAYQREANQFKSVVLLNNGNGSFIKIELPNIVQTMPILNMDTLDYNDDGFEDIVLAGNIFDTEVETPRLDNPFALILQSNQKDGYDVILPKESGLYTKGDVKSVATIKKGNDTYLIFGENNGPAEAFKLN
ncbi:MAG: VCBS repeat-containing protein [Flavobacteriaceae bacterium]|nr:VCBS repeat-containing protein [Flavobacteriaceae bacterium]